MSNNIPGDSTSNEQGSPVIQQPNLPSTESFEGRINSTQIGERGDITHYTFRKDVKWEDIKSLIQMILSALKTWPAEKPVKLILDWSIVGTFAIAGRSGLNIADIDFLTLGLIKDYNDEFGKILYNNKGLNFAFVSLIHSGTSMDIFTRMGDYNTRKTYGYGKKPYKSYTTYELSKAIKLLEGSEG